MKKLILFAALLLWTLPAFAADDESTFDRVMRTKTLRCAYTVYPSFLEKDPNTGAFSGMSYDIMNEIGKQLGIKIEWTEEVGSDAIFAGLGRRFDANCTGYFATPPRALGGDFSTPFVYIPYNIYVRSGETRFKTFADFNKPSVTIATLDGELSQLVAKEQFPQAKALELPGLTPATDRFEAVAGKKADATPMEAAIGAEYMAANPGKIKLFGDKPLRVGGSVIIIPHHEFELKRILDVSINSLLETGALERILAVHEKYPGTLLLPARGYQPE